MASFTDSVHASKRFKLGRRVTVDGNTFIYLKGVASTVVGSWVFFDDAGATTLTVANSKGRVGVAMAAIDATTKFGWYQIYGKATGKSVANTAGSKVWVTATAGTVDLTDVATDLVAGAIARSAVVAGLATFELNYPMCLNEVYN